ncbi:MAG: hypothetical protein JSV85_06505 [Candidatus Bathyarchaeota archaeon]|nr:MAG: hypothetical protein JSV85_06505 [Candidatus Bathyarchaeota archaeon]
MNVRKNVVMFIGITQEVIGVFAIAFACVLYFNIFDTRINLEIPFEHVSFYILLLFVFGFVSILSGLFLIRERLELGGGNS